MYFLATMLDPQFGLSWVDLDVTNRGNATSVKKIRDELKRTVTGKYYPGKEIVKKKKSP